jgi:hypothetical protein
MGFDHIVDLDIGQPVVGPKLLVKERDAYRKKYSKLRLRYTALDSLDSELVS